MRQLSILILFLFCLHLSVFSQQMIARQMPFFSQLPSNEIWDIYQDREGFIWIATTNGVARYDGYRLQSFRNEYNSPDLLTDNSIVCFTDNDRYVWIGTQKGVNLFCKKTYRILPLPETRLLDKKIDGMLVDTQERVWVAAEGTVFQCTPDGITLKEYVIPGWSENEPGVINSVYKDRNGNIWIVSNPKGLFKYDPAADRFLPLPPIEGGAVPFVMYPDNRDNYWIGTWGDGLWQFK